MDALIGNATANSSNEKANLFNYSLNFEKKNYGKSILYPLLSTTGEKKKESEMRPVIQRVLNVILLVKCLNIFPPSLSLLQSTLKYLSFFIECDQICVCYFSVLY